MSDDELRAIEARDAARTPGAWAWRPCNGNVNRIGQGPFTGSQRLGAGGSQDRVTAIDTATHADAAFIAACSVDVPRLCAALRGSQAELARVTAERDALAERLRLLEPADY